MTVFYHRTRRATADAILSQGFQDGTGTYMTGPPHTGVWLSDVPLDANDMGLAVRDTVILKVTLPGRLEDLADYEWIEEEAGKRYREWLVPADRINGAATVEVWEDDDE